MYELDKICGKCSQETGMVIEDRIELALSRLPNKIYNCPICKKNHAFKWKYGEVIRVQTQVNLPKKTPRKELREEQLTLF